MLEYREIAFCMVFKMWPSISLILLCQAILANDENHTDITTEPIIPRFFLNIGWSVLPPCSIYIYLWRNIILTESALNNIVWISSVISHCWPRSVIAKVTGAYSISQEICTRFCCALLCCGYAIVHNELTWSIYPYSSGLLCWHWGNR